MGKICWGISSLSLMIVAFLGYFMLVRGDISPSADGRTTINLSPAERDLFLAEMRGFLEAVQTITESIAKADLARAASAASKVGMSSTHEVPASLMAKLPLEVKKLGLDTHRAFDSLALDARQMQDAGVALSQLSTLMLNCTGCHASFRIGLSSK